MRLQQMTESEPESGADQGNVLPLTPPEPEKTRDGVPMSDGDQGSGKAQTERQRWMGLLARAPVGTVQSYCEGLSPRPGYKTLRKPEAGLVMLRGRAGATGRPFNAGEMTVTRCSVQLDNGVHGHAYIAGRDTAHAEAAALCDALLQDSSLAETIRAELIEPLAQLEAGHRRSTAQKAAATKVDFFTLVRGDS